MLSRGYKEFFNYTEIIYQFKWGYNVFFVLLGGCWWSEWHLLWGFKYGDVGWIG